MGTDDRGAPPRKRVLQGEFGEGATVRVDAKEGELTFTPVGAAEAAQQRESTGRWLRCPA